MKLSVCAYFDLNHNVLVSITVDGDKILNKIYKDDFLRSWY